MDCGDFPRRKGFRSHLVVLLCVLLCATLYGCTRGLVDSDSIGSAGEATSSSVGSGEINNPQPKPPNPVGDFSNTAGWLRCSCISEGDETRLVYTLVPWDGAEEKIVLTVRYSDEKISCEYPVSTTTDYWPNGSFFADDPNGIHFSISDEEVSVIFPDDTMLRKEADGRTTLRYADGVLATYNNGTPIDWMSGETVPPLYCYSIENVEEIPLSNLFSVGSETATQLFPNGTLIYFKLGASYNNVRVEAHYPNGVSLFDNGDSEGHVRLGFRSMTQLDKYSRSDGSVVSVLRDSTIPFRKDNPTTYPGGVTVERQQETGRNGSYSTIITYPNGIRSVIQGGEVTQTVGEFSRSQYPVPSQSVGEGNAASTHTPENEKTPSSDMVVTDGDIWEGTHTSTSVELIIALAALAGVTVLVIGGLLWHASQKKKWKHELEKERRLHEQQASAQSRQFQWSQGTVSLREEREDSYDASTGDGRRWREEGARVPSITYLGYYGDFKARSSSNQKEPVRVAWSPDGELVTENNLVYEATIQVFPKMGAVPDGTPQEGLINERNLENGLIPECFIISNPENHTGAVLRIRVEEPAVMKRPGKKSEYYELKPGSKGKILVLDVKGQ